MSEHLLDARRMLCPMPVIKTQNLIKKLTKGDKVKVICTDPGVLEDIPAWCRIHGHTIISKETASNKEIIIEIVV